MQLNIQGLELLCKMNPCLSEDRLHLGAWLTLKYNRYELLLNLACSNVSSCLIGAISPRICWGFFLIDVTLHSWREILTKKSSKQQWNIHSCASTYPQVRFRKFAALGIFFVLKIPVGCHYFLVLDSLSWTFGERKMEVHWCWWNLEKIQIWFGFVGCGLFWPFLPSPSLLGFCTHIGETPRSSSYFSVNNRSFEKPFWTQIRASRVTSLGIWKEVLFPIKGLGVLVSKWSVWNLGFLGRMSKRTSPR